MKVFVAASYSSQVDYQTGEVVPEYRAWLEKKLTTIEGFGHSVFCALRADSYKINAADPAEAFRLDVAQIAAADAMIAFLTDKVSAGVQTEIGYALALGKRVVLVHDVQDELAWFNMAMVASGEVTAVTLPLRSDPLKMDVTDRGNQ